MNELLEIIMSYFSYLYYEYGGRIIDSETDGYNALIIVKVDSLRIRFVRDRGETCVDFQCEYENDGSWYMYSLLRLWMSKESVDDLIDENAAKYIREHFYEIQIAFNPKQYWQTKEILNKLARARADQMWPN